MTTCVEKTDFDLQIVDDIKALDDIAQRIRWAKTDSIEYFCLREEFSQKESVLNRYERQQRNLCLFNRELYSHGIRRWAYHGPFIVTEERVHNKREHEHFIYMPAWAVTEHFGISSGCGNANQRQFTHNASYYFGEFCENEIIDIINEDGGFDLKTTNEVDVSDYFKYWLSR